MRCGTVLLATIVLLFGVFYSVVSNPVPFQVENGGEFSIIRLAKSDQVIVAGANIVYRLSANLSMLDNVTTSSTVRGLSLTNGGQYVMVCVDTGRSCSGYNVTDFNDTVSGVMLRGTANSQTDPVAMFPGEVAGSVYVGTAVVQPGQYPMTLGQYSITGGSIGLDRDRVYDIRTLVLNERIFHTGFVIDSYAYYIVGDRGIDIRILRVCMDPTPDPPRFRALYEVQLVCNDNAGSAAVFRAAALVRDNPQPGNHTLLLTVVPPFTVTGGSTRVCAYSIRDIDNAMNDSFRNCLNQRIDRTVWSRSTLTDMQLSGICAQRSVS